MDGHSARQRGAVPGQMKADAQGVVLGRIKASVIRAALPSQWEKEMGIMNDKNNKINIWIDCDPGIDDAVALAMTAASRDALHLLGVSTVAGNQTSDRVTGNALKLTAFFGMDDVPVVRGARGPLVRPVEPAEDIHGADGLGNGALPEMGKNVTSESGIFYMYTRMMALPDGERVTLVPTGPLTNIALLLRTFPEVKKKIARIVLMGGSSSGGNVTPAAEFNIWADPEAAQMVFAAGLPIVMCGLDVTLKSGLYGSQIETLCRSSRRAERACGQMLRFYLDATRHEGEEDMVAIHDAVTILYLTNPELFGGRNVTVNVDCDWGAERGRTICMDESNRQSVYLLDQVNLPEFQRILLAKLKSL